MKTSVLLSNKGGVGKSASAVTLSHIAATLYDKRTLLIDLDPQGNTSSFFSEEDVLERLISIIKGQPSGTISKSVEDLFVDSNLDIHETIRHTKYKNLDIIPSFLTLSEVEERLKADIRTPQQFRLLNHLKAVEDDYDYCIIDCSPSVNIININGLVAADEVFIPLKCDAWSVMGMFIAKNLIQTVSTYNPRLKIAGLFFTQWEGRKNVSAAVYNLIVSFFPDLLLPFTIGKSKLVEEMTLEQIPLLEYDTQKKHSKVTKDYIELTEYIISDPIKRVAMKEKKFKNSDFSQL